MPFRSAGVYLGGKVGLFVRNRVEILGGLVLMAIGIKILVEYLGMV
ncbi:MAG: manganese efflux pump MntP family protein [Candidatus Bathyarchaeota archaeon]|nr:manganese efflux pump MntP family protein [Candidatus Bathyarchaeota archaeon]